MAVQGYVCSIELRRVILHNTNVKPLYDVYIKYSPRIQDGGEENTVAR